MQNKHNFPFIFRKLWRKKVSKGKEILHLNQDKMLLGCVPLIWNGTRGISDFPQVLGCPRGGSNSSSFSLSGTPRARSRAKSAQYCHTATSRLWSILWDQMRNVPHVMSAGVESLGFRSIFRLGTLNRYVLSVKENLENKCDKMFSSSVSRSLVPAPPDTLHLVSWNGSDVKRLRRQPLCAGSLHTGSSWSIQCVPFYKHVISCSRLLENHLPVIILKHANVIFSWMVTCLTFYEDHTVAGKRENASLFHKVHGYMPPTLPLGGPQLWIIQWCVV